MTQGGRTFVTTNTEELWVPRAHLILPQGNSLVLVSVRSWVDFRITKCRDKE